MSHLPGWACRSPLAPPPRSVPGDMRELAKKSTAWICDRKCGLRRRDRLSRSGLFAHLGPRVAQTHGAVEHERARLGVRIAGKIALALELHGVGGIVTDQRRLDHGA